MKRTGDGPRVWRAAATASVWVMLAGVPQTARAQGAAAIDGVVRDSASGVGISGAVVSLAGQPYQVRTDEAGRFHLALAPAAGMTLQIRRLGYRPASLPVATEAAHEHAVRLATAAQPLAPVVVRAERRKFTGRLAGYYERLERRTQGTFITRADIERERPPQLTDLLQRSPGVRVTRGRPSAQSVRLRGQNCRPLVWLDGAPMGAGDVDLDAFAPTTLEGIEIYMGANIPARFQAARGQAECGTVVLWSRGPDTEPARAVRGVSAEELEALVAGLTVFERDEVDSAAVLLAPEGWQIPYPAAMQAAGTSGRVTAEFVVDTMGVTEATHLGVVSSTDAYFSVAVLDAVRAARFRPAVRQGRPVRQLVRQTFEFQPGDRGGKPSG